MFKMNFHVILLVAILPLLSGHSSLQQGPYQGIDSCHPWLYDNGSSCVCGQTDDIQGNLVTCNQTLQVSYLLLDYCMTYNNVTNLTQLFYCPYEIPIKDKTILKRERQVVLNTSVSKLEKFFCNDLKREGLFCERCKKNHGPSAFTENLNCVNCTKTPNGWIFYFTMEYLPLTVLFVVIIFTGITPLSGSMNSFVMLSQLFSLLFSYGNQDQLIPLSGNKSLQYLVRFIRTLYGFWNLDFFRGLVDNFCVSSKLNNLQAISVHLLMPFYAPVLLLIASIFIFLHNRNCRLIVKIWKPFKRCLSHFPVPNDIKSYMIRLFVTFYILGYTKILHTCTLLLVKGYVFSLNGNKSVVLLMSPDIEYFSHEHTLYATVALFLLITVIFTPAVLLTIYPLLDKKCGQFTRLNFIVTTMDIFSSCFKNGEDGRMDCRHFAGGFLLLRIVAVMLFSAIWSPIVTYFTITAVFFLASITVCVFRPYKKKLHNILDIIFFLLLTLGILCGSIANFSSTSDNLQIALVVFALISFLSPLLYASLYVSYRLLKLIIVMVMCCSKKRRQYEEVVNYDDYLTSSNEHAGLPNYGSTPAK